MSVIIDVCFDHAVGITRRECDCTDNDQIPVDYDESLSGYYIDELPGMDLIGISELGGCEPELWTLVQNGQNYGIQSLKTDLMREILKEAQPRFPSFAGRIGTQKTTDTAQVSTAYAGSTFSCNPIKDGYFKLKKIGLLFDTSLTFDIVLYNNRSETPLQTFTVTSVANVFTVYTLPTPLELPLSDDDYRDLQYFFLYEPTTQTPLNNTVDCCGNFCWDKDNPCWVARNIKLRWQNFLMVAGTEGDDLEDREDWATTNELNGLTFDIDIYCNAFNLICNDQTDFANDPVDNMKAKALWYKWGSFLMERKLASREVNREVVTNREAMAQYHKFYNEEYINLIQQIAEQIDLGQSGCLKCKDHWGLSVKEDIR